MKPEIFGVLALAIVAVPALAQQQQPPCAPLETVLRALEAGPHEVPAFRGVDERGVLALLTLSPDGSYTVLVVNPQNRIACVVSTGSGWEAVEHLPGRGS